MSYFSFSPGILTNPVIPIDTFRSVSITKRNPLVLCDIDDTIIGYDKNFDYFYNTVITNREKYKNANNGPANIFNNILNNQSLTMTNNEVYIVASRLYDEYRQRNPPKHCDYEGFMRMCKKIQDMGGELQFVTARSKESADFTKMQFNEIGLNYDNYKVHYTGGIITKGQYIKQNFHMSKYGEVIFIDDLDSFIKSVVEWCPVIQCYKFVYRR